VWWHASAIPAVGEDHGLRPVWAKIEPPYEKITKAKKGWGHGSSGRVPMPNKHEALRRKKGKKEGRKEGFHLRLSHLDTFTFHIISTINY
jgi:hypothetical protein